MKEPKGTGLQRTVDAEFGKSLIAEAQKQNRETLQNQVVGHVRELMVFLHKQRDYLASTEANIALLEAKLAALEAGEFTLSTYGKITFTNEALQKSVVSMQECANCGYSAKGVASPDPVYWERRR